MRLTLNFVATLVRAGIRLIKYFFDVIETYTKGTIVVDIWDAKEKMLLWRGTATDTLSDKPEKNEKKIDKSFEKLFEKFPPDAT